MYVEAFRSRVRARGPPLAAPVRRLEHKPRPVRHGLDLVWTTGERLTLGGLDATSSTSLLLDSHCHPAAHPGRGPLQRAPEALRYLVDAAGQRPFVDGEQRPRPDLRARSAARNPGRAKTGVDH